MKQNLNPLANIFDIIKAVNDAISYSVQANQAGDSVSKVTSDGFSCCVDLNKAKEEFDENHPRFRNIRKIIIDSSSYLTTFLLGKNFANLATIAAAFLNFIEPISWPVASVAFLLTIASVFYNVGIDIYTAKNDRKYDALKDFLDGYIIQQQTLNMLLEYANIEDPSVIGFSGHKINQGYNIYTPSILRSVGLSLRNNFPSFGIAFIFSFFNISSLVTRQEWYIELILCVSVALAVGADSKKIYDGEKYRANIINMRRVFECTAWDMKLPEINSYYTASLMELTHQLNKRSVNLMFLYQLLTGNDMRIKMDKKKQYSAIELVEFISEQLNVDDEQAFRAKMLKEEKGNNYPAKELLKLKKTWGYDEPFMVEHASKFWYIYEVLKDFGTDFLKVLKDGTFYEPGVWKGSVKMGAIDVNDENQLKETYKVMAEKFSTTNKNNLDCNNSETSSVIDLPKITSSDFYEIKEKEKDEILVIDMPEFSSQFPRKNSIADLKEPSYHCSIDINDEEKYPTAAINNIEVIKQKQQFRGLNCAIL